MAKPGFVVNGCFSGVTGGLFGLLLFAIQAVAEEPARTQVQDQRSFASPEAAVEALMDALETQSRDELAAIFGPASEDIISSGDEVADREVAQRFLEKARHKVGFEEQAKDRLVVDIGEDGWPFAIPLVKGDKGWRFDTEGGEEELLDRRIGHNELNAIAVERAYVDAQREYADLAKERTGVRQYAQRLLSSEGKRDGLYWEVEPGEPESPMGPLVAAAAEVGYRKADEGEGPNPYYGYYYKVLGAQGSHAPGGAKSYLDDAGHMSAGFALLAYPADYGNSGIMSFMVNRRGIVYQKDLGEDTEAIAKAITEYDPDDSWEPVVDATD